MEIAVVSEVGRRAVMEDTYFVDDNLLGRGWLFGGIYDGHAGGFAARYAAERLHKIFVNQVMAGATPQQAFVHSYEMTSQELSYQDSGTTAVTFLMRGKSIFTANVGDARAIVIGQQGFSQLTIDHRLSNVEEGQRIKDRGGIISYPYVYRGNQGLMPTRSIGDQFFKEIGIIATPSLSEYSITQDDRLLVAACDGLFDVMTNEEIAQLAGRLSQPQELVSKLRDEVLFHRYGTDNLTILVVSLAN